MPRTPVTNGQSLPATVDVFDEKGKRIAALPADATVVYTESNSQIAQWVPDASDPLKGKVTTLHDDVGDADITATITFADGKVFTPVLELTVTNSAPSTASFTPGTPENE